jgi:hypothetical protein
MDSRVIAWLREFFLGRTQRVKVGQVSGVVRVMSCVQQGCVLVLLMFLSYFNDFWRTIDSTVRVFVDDCIIYKKLLIKRT